MRTHSSKQPLWQGLLLASGLLFVGISIFDDPIWCSLKLDLCVDLSDYNRLFSIVLIIAAGYVGWLSWNREPLPQKTLICPSCESTHRTLLNSKKLCSTCKVDLEPLEGFYERHPEKKDEKQKL